MKRALTLGIGALALAGMTIPSAAADLGARPIPRAPAMAPAPVFSWTGCYIGGFVGGASGGDVTTVDRGVLAGGAFTGVAYNPPVNHAWAYELDSTFIGGGTLGCNYQWPGSSFVIGIEGEVGYMQLEGSAADPLSPALDTISSTSIGDWYGMITGRIGWAFNTLLIYGKGGAAFVDVSHVVSDTCNVGGCGLGLVVAPFSDTVTTWTAGGGVEWAFAPNWSLKAEYMFIALDDVNRGCGVNAFSGSTVCWDHTLDGVHTGKLGVNFRF